MHYAVEAHSIVEICALFLPMNAQCRIVETAALSLKYVLIVYIWTEKGVAEVQINSAVIKRIIFINVSYHILHHRV